MTNGRPGTLLRDLRRLAAASPCDHLHDGQLLGRFILDHDETAFEALVRRHGPMVLRVGLRVLPNLQDAEDICQATFLTLARRASSIRQSASVASWLYGVAYRMAMKARAHDAKRRAREQRKTAPVHSQPLAELTGQEICRILDEELQRLPTACRQALVLCLLEGRTRDEAAQQLGLSLATLKRRLEQGRALLRKRLGGRGLGLAAVLSAAALAEAAASAALPSRLMLPLIHAATRIAAGKAMAGLVSAKVAALTEGMVLAMFLNKLKTIAMTLAALLSVGAGGLALLGEARAPVEKELVGQLDPRPSARQDVVPARTGAERSGKTAEGDMRQLESTWSLEAFEFDGVKVPGAQVKSLGVRWVIQGDKIVESMRGKTRNLTFRLDPARQPKRIELTVVSGEGGEFFPGGTDKGEKIPGIYRLQQDGLAVCIDAKDKKSYPDKFETSKDQPFVIYVFKPQKGAEKQSAPVDDLPGELQVGHSRLRQLSLALQLYENDHGRLPPPAICSKDGKPLLSWRVALLPYLDESFKDLYNEFKLDEPWDSAHNKKLLEKMPQFYASPSALPKERFTTFYQVFVGKSTAFDGALGRKTSDLKDFASTVLIVEAADAVPWTKPQDLAYDPAKALPKLGGPFITGFHAAMGFERIYFIKKKDFDEASLRGEIERAVDP